MDQTGTKRQQLEELTQGLEITLSRFTQLEILQGAKNEKEWQLFQSYLEFQQYLEANSDTWSRAARIYFDLRRKGNKVRSPIDSKYGSYR